MVDATLCSIEQFLGPLESHTMIHDEAFMTEILRKDSRVSQYSILVTLTLSLNLHLRSPRLTRVWVLHDDNT